MKKIAILLAILACSSPALAQRTFDAPRVRATNAGDGTEEGYAFESMGSARIWKNLFLTAPIVTADGTVSAPPALIFRFSLDAVGGGLVPTTENGVIQVFKQTPTAERFMHLNAGNIGSASNVRIVDDQGMEFAGAPVLPVSGANLGRLRYNATAQSFQVSENGGAWFSLAKGDIPTSATANQVFAGPTTGAAAAPAFRALVTADIPVLDTSKITTGIFDVARIPNMDAAKITTGIFDVARIPALDTAKITTGIFDVARIPNLDAAKITTGIFDVARIPNLDTAKITTGVFGAAFLPATTSYLGASIETGEIADGTILFGDWSQNACALGNIPKWNGTAWACAGDDTSPGGTSWLTTGNTLGATGIIGSLDAFGFDIITNNIIRGNVDTTGDLNWNGRIDMNSGTVNHEAIIGGSNIGTMLGFYGFTNRTSTLPATAASQSYIIMDNGVLKANQGGAGWVPLLAPTIETLARFVPNDAEQPPTNFGTFGVRNNHPILMFDQATDEEVYFTGVVPTWYDNAASIQVVIQWVAASATTDNVIWTATIERMDIGTDIDADSWGTEISVTQTAAGIAGQSRYATATLTRTQADTLTASEGFRVRIRRDANAVGDTMAGDAQLLSVQIRRQ